MREMDVGKKLLTQFSFFFLIERQEGPNLLYNMDQKLIPFIAVLLGHNNNNNVIKYFC